MKYRVKPNIPGIHFTADQVHLPKEPEPLNRRIYAYAKLPFAFLAEIASWLGSAVLVGWIAALAIAAAVATVALLWNILTAFDASQFWSVVAAHAWGALKASVYGSLVTVPLSIVRQLRS